MPDHDSRLEMELLNLYRETDLNSLLEKLAKKVKDLLQCQEASIFIYHPEKEELSFIIATGEKGDDLKTIILKKDQGIAGWIASHRESVSIHDCGSDPRFAAEIDRRIGFFTLSLLGVPIFLGNELLGVLEAVNKRSAAFTPEDLETLKQIAHFCAIPLQNALLFHRLHVENREKGQLLRLGQSISASLGYREILSSLPSLIADIARIHRIRIYISPEKTLFEFEKGELREKSGADMFPPKTADRSLCFPLNTAEKKLGWWEIIFDQEIPETTAAILQGLSAFIAVAVEKQEMVKEMVEKEKVARELEIARQIQNSFLIPPGLSFPGIDIAYINISSSAVGGDYYDIQQTAPGKFLFSIHDISGHGVPASLLMSIFRSSFLYGIKKGLPVSRNLEEINDLISETTDASLYVTSFCAWADIADGTLNYINAGHPPALLFHRGKCQELPSNAMVIGMIPGTPFSPLSIPIHPGDLLVLYTDGVVEAPDPRGDFYGTERLQEFLRRQGKRPAKQMLDNLLEELRRFHVNPLFPDDLTLLLIQFA